MVVSVVPTHTPSTKGSSPSRVKEESGVDEELLEIMAAKIPSATVAVAMYSPKTPPID